MPLSKLVSSLLFLCSFSLCLSNEEELTEAAEWSERLTAKFQTVGGYRATYAGRKKNDNFKVVIIALSDRSQLWAIAEFESEEEDQTLYWLANNEMDSLFFALNGVCISGAKHMNSLSKKRSTNQFTNFPRYPESRQKA